MKKCIISYSGGLDSTVLLWSLYMSRKYDEIHCISYNYGQRHDIEIECAKWNIEYLNSLDDFKTKVIWKQIDIPFIRDIAPTSYLTSNYVEMPTGETDETPTSYVPNRNMIMISIAASYAESVKAEHIAYGAMKDDFGGYWDCKPQFYELLNMLFTGNPDHSVEIITPFMEYSKEDIIKLGIDLGVRFEHTWSDFSGGIMHFSTNPQFDNEIVPDFNKSTEKLFTSSTLYSRVKADAESANSRLRIISFAKLGYIDPLPYYQDLTEFWKKYNCKSII